MRLKLDVRSTTSARISLSQFQRVLAVQPAALELLRLPNGLREFRFGDSESESCSGDWEEWRHSLMTGETAEVRAQLGAEREWRGRMRSAGLMETRLTSLVRCGVAEAAQWSEWGEEWPWVGAASRALVGVEPGRNQALVGVSLPAFAALTADVVFKGDGALRWGSLGAMYGLLDGEPRQRSHAAAFVLSKPEEAEGEAERLVSFLLPPDCVLRSLPPPALRSVEAAAAAIVHPPSSTTVGRVSYLHTFLSRR